MIVLVMLAVHNQIRVVVKSAAAGAFTLRAGDVEHRYQATHSLLIPAQKHAMAERPHRCDIIRLPPRPQVVVSWSSQGSLGLRLQVVRVHKASHHSRRIVPRA